MEGGGCTGLVGVSGGGFTSVVGLKSGGYTSQYWEGERRVHWFSWSGFTSELGADGLLPRDILTAGAIRGS